MTLSENQSSIGRHGRVWRFVPLVLWIGVIFLLSSSQGSFNETSRIIRPILEFLFPTASPETITFYHGVIRKFAHFAEYAVLASLALRAFSRSPKSLLRQGAPFVAFALVVVVASLDEFQQSFTATRTSSLADVLIDMAGGLSALVAIYLRSTFISFRQKQV